MESDNLSVEAQLETAQFTTVRLRDIVLDHVLDNTSIFLPDGNTADTNAADKLLKMLDSLEQMALKIASEAITNRHNLSPLPTFQSTISADPEEDVSDSTRYEMRYRMTEQIGDEAPFKDEVLSRKEAEEQYGTAFLHFYWGQVGERCPNSIQTGDRTIWFSVVRYPVQEQTLKQQATDNETPRYRAPSPR